MRAHLLIIFASYPSSALPANMTVINNTTEVQRSSPFCACPQTKPYCRTNTFGYKYCYAVSNNDFFSSSVDCERYDGYDGTCSSDRPAGCSTSCPSSFLGDGECDTSCDSAACLNDGGDCGSLPPSSVPNNVDDDDDDGSPSTGCQCPSSNPNCLSDGDGRSLCVSDAYTDCSLEACVYTDNWVTNLGINGGSGCGEHGTLFPPSFGGPNCGESHPDGKVAAVENVAKGLAIGIIIAIVVGGVIGGLLLILLLKCLLMAICK